MERNLKEKGTLVECLWHAVDGATGDLAQVPGLIHEVIASGAWRERDYHGKTYRNDSFLEFITAKPLRGCGWPPEKVELLLRDDPVVLTEWREATTARHGGDRVSGNSKNNNIILDPIQGTSLSYTLDRLKRERPDLFRRVVKKELSANAAAIEAGWRKVPSAMEQIRKLLRKLTAEERDVLREELSIDAKATYSTMVAGSRG
jgi:hypothetical protein